MYILATHNPGKVNELNNLFKDYDIKFVGLNELGIPDIEETGTTYQENALIKARTVAEMTGCICVADDSGIEIEALGNAPGVYSARYSNDLPFLPGETKGQRNIRKTITEFHKLGIHSSPACYISCLVAVKPKSMGGKEMIVKGIWKGSVIDTPKGTNGFGYDPVFFDPEKNKTSAEMTTEEKKHLTHRAKALKQLMDKWNDFISE